MTTHLRESVEFLDACIRDLNDTAAEREFTADEQGSFDSGLAERARLVALIARHDEVSRLAAVPGAAVSGSFEAPNVIVRDSLYTLDGIAHGDDTAVRSQALAAIEADKVMSSSQKDEADRVVRTLGSEVAARVALTSSPEYGSAFLKAIAGREHLFTDAERAAVQRAVTLGGTAGYAVPAPIDTTIVDTAAHSTNPVRQLATVKKIAGTYWTGVSSAGVTASWDAESAEVSDDAPTLAALQIPAWKGQAFVPFSVESEDWASLGQDVGVMIANAKEDLESAAFITGNGTSAPQGITVALDGGSSEIAPLTAEAFAKGDIDKLIGALPARFRRNASFLANHVWLNAIRAFETTVNVGSLISTMPADYAGDFTLSGYPVYESSDMDAVLPNAAATADNFGLIFGDLSQAYYIVDRVGLNIELVPTLFHTSNNRPSGQRGFHAFWRTGGEVVNASAVVMLSIPTAA